jgi:hypothetical protein
MSATPDHEARPRQQLGQLLINAGLLAPAALELALAEQKQTGKTLGQILVSRGFLPAPTVAAALAEQAGGLLKTEYGYATGLASDLRRPAGETLPAPPPVTNEELAEVVILDPAARAAEAPPSRSPDADDLRLRHEALIAAHAQLEGVLGERDTRIADLEARLEALQASYGEAMLVLTASRTASESERQRFDEMLPELSRAAADTVELRRQLAEQSEIRARSEGALAERSRIEEEIARLGLAHTERDDRRLEQKLEEAEARAGHAESEVDRLRAELAHPEPPPAAPAPVQEARHLLFAPGKDGYELLDRDGPAPALGELVTLEPGRQLRVVRIGPSPLPGERVRCAYLERLSPGNRTPADAVRSAGTGSASGRATTSTAP